MQENCVVLSRHVCLLHPRRADGVDPQVGNLPWRSTALVHGSFFIGYMP